MEGEGGWDRLLPDTRVGGEVERGVNGLSVVVGEERGDEVALGAGVAERVEGRFGAGEVEEGVDLVAVAGGVEDSGPAGDVPRHALVGESEWLGMVKPAKQ